MKIMCFSPTVVRVDAGTTVHFVNRDEMTHLVTGVAYQWGSPEPLPGGATLDVAFDQPGTYPYSCMLHYGMTGVIVVGGGRFAGGPGPAVKSSSASVSAPAAAIAAQTSADAPSPARSPWFYAGAGALGGFALAAVGFGLGATRRSDRS